MKPIPTTQELNESLANDLKNKLNLSDNRLKKVFKGLAIVLSAQIKLIYLFLSDIQNNIFPDTADLEANGGTLERIGRIYLNRNPNPATVGVFEVLLNGVSGSVIPVGLTFKSNEDAKNSSQLYITDLEYILTGTNDIIDIRSLGGGIEFALNLNDKLTITEPIIGIDQTVIINSIIDEPKATESTEIYRQKILDAIQLEPQGGSKTDYRVWASDAQGVRKVYPYVKNGDAGTVQIFVEATKTDSTDQLGTPSTALLNEVEQVINFDPDVTRPTNERGRKPIQATLEVLAITLIPVDIQIVGLADSSNTVKASIKSNLDLFLEDVRPYVAGADLARNKNDILYQAKLQSVVTDVLDSNNFFNDMVVQVNGVTITSSQFNLGNIPYLRNLIYS